MATVLDNLKTRRANLAAELARIVQANDSATTNVGGHANASGDGVNVDHVGYANSLLDQIEKLDRLISTAEGAAGDVGVEESEEWN